jgi:bifunctional non-homologous end joining protein LigD
MIDHGQAKLVSRNGNPFSSFADLADSVAAGLSRIQHAVLDGEIVCLDANGRPNFRDLLFRSGQPVFVAFDLLLAQQVDLRLSGLVERKAELRRILDRGQPGPVLFADHVEGAGIALFDRACELDLEGIVAKRKLSPYLLEGIRSPWVKIRNPHYSQWAGRDELFERERRSEPVAGWHACEVACADRRI